MKTIGLIAIIIFGGLLLLAVLNTVAPTKTIFNPGDFEIVAAGVPKVIGETKDYERIFKDLKVAGISAFLATFQFQEVPEPKSLGFEADFIPPCNPDDPGYRALRTSGMKLLVPGELLYRPDVEIPLAEDPLKKLIDCAGKEAIFGILSYDEPFFRDLFEPSKKLYKRVKEIDPTLPVFLVHGPVLAELGENGTYRPITQDEVEFYLQEIKKYNSYADFIGFDVYPIPPDLARNATPYSLLPADHRKAIADHVRWLKENTGGKPYFIALQAFAYKDLGDEWLGKKTIDVYPTREELNDMVRIAKEGGVSKVIWWGQSLIKKSNLSFWNDVLEAGKQ